MPAGLPQERLPRVDPVGMVQLGILGDCLVDRGGQRLPLPGGVAVEERPDDGHDGDLACHVVGVPHLRRYRRGVVGTGYGVGVVAAVHHYPAQREMDEVRRFVLAPRPGVAERRDPHPDQPRVRPLRRLVGDAEPVEVAAWRRLQEDVAARQQIEQPLALRGGVDGQPALAEVVVPEIQAPIGVGNAAVERTDLPRGVAFGRLQLHYVRTEPGEQLPGVFAGLVRQLDYADAAQIAAVHRTPVLFVCHNAPLRAG